VASTGNGPRKNVQWLNFSLSDRRTSDSHHAWRLDVSLLNTVSYWLIPGLPGEVKSVHGFFSFWQILIFALKMDNKDFPPKKRAKKIIIISFIEFDYLFNEQDKIVCSCTDLSMARVYSLWNFRLAWGKNGCIFDHSSWVSFFYHLVWKRNDRSHAIFFHCLWILCFYHPLLWNSDDKDCDDIFYCLWSVWFYYSMLHSP